MRKLILFLLLCSTAWASKTTLTGTITDPQGNLLNGILVMQLPVPAQDTTTNTAVAPSPVFFRLVNGVITGGAQLYDVATLQPQGLYYAAAAYDTTGTKVMGGNYYVTGATFNLGAATPTSIVTANVAYANLCLISPGTCPGSINPASVSGIQMAAQAASIQAALNTCANPGTEVYLAAGTYTLTTGLTSNCQNLYFHGAGGAGDEVSSGAISTDCPTTIVVPSGQVGFTFNPTGAATNFRGPTLKDICFVGQSGATGGIHILRTNNFTIDHVGSSYFSGAGAYGIWSDGTGNLNQYGVINNDTLVGNNFDIIGQLGSGIRITANHLDNAANTGNPAAGTKGIYLKCPAASNQGTYIIANNVIVGSDILIDSECGQNDSFRDNRFEGFITAAIRLQQLNSLTASGDKISGGSINNFINGSVGTGISVGTGVTNVQVDVQAIQSVATVISPQADTWYQISNNNSANAILELPQAAQIQFGNGADNLINRDASGRLKITNNLLVNNLACLANVDTCLGRSSVGLVSSPSIASTGTAAGLTGTGACATITTQTGGSFAGSAKCTGTTGASTLTITPGQTAPNGWTCDVWDETTRANVFQQTSHTQTTCVLTVTSVTQNDVFVFKAIAF